MQPPAASHGDISILSFINRKAPSGTGRWGLFFFLDGIWYEKQLKSPKEVTPPGDFIFLSLMKPFYEAFFFPPAPETFVART